MSLLDKIRRCNARNLTRYLPLLIDGERLGFVTPERAAILARHPGVFEVRPDQIVFNPALQSPEARTHAVERIAEDLFASGLFFKRKGEAYGVRNDWHDTPRLRIDRALIPAFGFRAYGVHINGFVRNASGFGLWIGTRAMSSAVEPGKLDNMVAGGQPADLGLMDNVIKECAEEASLPEALARTAVPVSTITYSFDAPEGLKVDSLFCFDLEMPEGHPPINSDGELSTFRLMPLVEALALISETTDFKFNVNLVIIDFAVRHGVLRPDDVPDYEKLVSGLHERP